jgi:hypothetical protein
MTTATLTDAGKNLRRDATRGVVAHCKVLYVAVGTDSTAPTSSDTALGAETFRKAITATGDGASAGEATFTMALSPQDAVGTVIAEVGWFGGPDASATPGSGVLIARGLYSHTKTDKESINTVFDLIL